MNKSARQLKKVFDEILNEVNANEGFGARLLELLIPTNSAAENRTKRPHRRAPAKFDPIAMVGSGGEVGLRRELGELVLEELRDVVAEYAMDPAKLVMKWNARERVIDHIVETAVSRANKGDAFR